MLQDLSDKTQLELELTDRKLGMANELALTNRKIIAEQTNKINFLECDIEVKQEEFASLESSKTMLIEQMNELKIKFQNQERQFKMQV